MTCIACDGAVGALTHSFHDCHGCRCRAVARSPGFAETLKGGRQWPDYIRMLERVGVTHDEVIAAARDDRACDQLMSKSPSI